MKQKLISLAEAVRLVEPGQMLALGGMTLYRRPVAFVHALLKRFKQTGQPGKLTLFAFTAGLESDLLVGAGLIQRVRTCYFGLEIFGLAPMFTYCATVRLDHRRDRSKPICRAACPDGSIEFHPRRLIGTDSAALPGC
jgi:acyl CoA:acetate/3-ketoacid CoA transferase alpha subunit